MNIVTLTSDFGTHDHYAAMLKGAILSRTREVMLVDITHDLDNHDIVKAAFVLHNAYPAFPKGSIHVLSVNNYYATNAQFLAIRHQGHYFIGPDNGVFSLLFETQPDEVYILDFRQGAGFPLKDLFARAISHITEGKPFNEIGLPSDGLEERITLQPVISSDSMRGTVIYVDKYENVILNISRELFERVGQNRRFELYFKRHDPITDLSETYADVNVGDMLCFFNSSDYLEIAVNMGQAATLLGLEIDDTIQIDFLS